MNKRKLKVGKFLLIKLCVIALLFLGLFIYAGFYGVGPFAKSPKIGNVYFIMLIQYLS